MITAVGKDATSAVKPTTCVAPPSQEIRDAHLTKDPNGAATLRKPNRPKYLGAPLIIERHPKTHEDADMKQTHSWIWMAKKDPPLHMVGSLEWWLFCSKQQPNPHHDSPIIGKKYQTNLGKQKNVQINAFQNTEVVFADWSRTMAICFADVCNQTYAASHKAKVWHELHAHFLVAGIWRGTPPNIIDPVIRKQHTHAHRHSYFQPRHTHDTNIHNRW